MSQIFNIYLFPIDLMPC